MSYQKCPNLIDTAREEHDSDVTCSGDPYVYASLNWISTQIDQLTLEASQINLYKARIIEQLRADVSAQRNVAVSLILGTNDVEQLRTYDEKFDEASAYLVYPTTPTPIMDAEVAQTGETVAALAPLVVAQYDATKSALRSQYGHIEGVRRNNIAIIVAMTTIAQLKAYAGPTW